MTESISEEASPDRGEAGAAPSGDDDGSSSVESESEEEGVGLDDDLGGRRPESSVEAEAEAPAALSAEQIRANARRFLDNDDDDDDDDDDGASASASSSSTTSVKRTRRGGTDSPDGAASSTRSLPCTGTTSSASGANLDDDDGSPSARRTSAPPLKTRRYRSDVRGSIALLLNKAQSRALEQEVMEEERRESGREGSTTSTVRVIKEEDEDEGEDEDEDEEYESWGGKDKHRRWVAWRICNVVCLLVIVAGIAVAIGLAVKPKSGGGASSTAGEAAAVSVADVEGGAAGFRNPPEEVESVCVENMIQDKAGYCACHALCEEAFCCYLPRHQQTSSCPYTEDQCVVYHNSCEKLDEVDCAEMAGFESSACDCGQSSLIRRRSRG